MPYFGPAGNSVSFYQSGGKSSVQIPEWLATMGLNAYEYQAGRGVRISRPMAAELGRAAQRHGIKLSIHAPYYINLTATDAKIVANTRKHLLAAMEAADAMGAGVVVFHPGSGGGKELGREMAFNLARERLAEITQMAVSRGLSHVRLAVETAGKKNQLGNLVEIAGMCNVHPMVIPCIDFAHLHALDGGSISTLDDYLQILNFLAKNLGIPALENLHIHFSPIEYTTGGEKKHRTLAAQGFGPPFEPLAKILAERNYEWTIICESDDTQTEDALAYQRMWKSAAAGLTG